MNKVLVVATYYPETNQSYGGVFYHTRNKYYLTKGIDVTVVSFTAKKDYVLDGVNVITVETYSKITHSWNILICHAPDRNIYSFLKSYSKEFSRIIFFIHGNEVLKRNNYYKFQYSYIESGKWFSREIQNIRDDIKLMTWKKMYLRLIEKSWFVFVSNWMREEFLRNIKIDKEIVVEKSSIIYNCIGKEFEVNNYKTDVQKKYDFITIRGSLDSSKYATDIVCTIAEANKDSTFLIVGKGKYFKYNRKPDNLTWIDQNLSHEEIINYLNMSRCALMPTRHDAQGVMMCEMATFGIPLITSDISVCKEVLKGFENIVFVSNEHPVIDCGDILRKLKVNGMARKNDRYFMCNTCEQEVALLQEGFNVK